MSSELHHKNEATLEAFLPRNMLSVVPSSLACSCIAIYLSDDEACTWVRCSRQSLMQLQLYAFKRITDISRMLSLNTPMRRPVAAFGRVSHVRIGTANDWIENLTTLPSFVQRVTIDISDLEAQKLNALYHQADSKNSGHSAFVCLPSSVRELHFLSRPDEWAHQLKFADDSCLRVVHFPERTSGWTSLPRFIRQSLPDAVVDLGLPRTFEYRNSQPSAEHYPARWPPNLTKLRLACHVGSPFAAGELPPFPPTLTSIFTITRGELFDLDAKSVQRMLSLFPDTITSLETRGRSMDGSWKLPAGLLSLRLFGVQQISGPFTFPPRLRELELRHFSQPEMLNALLPATLTSLMLHVPPSIEHPFRNMQWPSNLLTLEFDRVLSTTLTEWTPPPQLTKLKFQALYVPLESIMLPSTLRTLCIGDYSHSLSKVYFPPYLEHLEINDPLKSPCLSIESWHPPAQLQSLLLAAYRDEPFYLPPSLTRLVVRRNYEPSSFKLLFESLPLGLQELDMRRSYCCRLPLDTLQLPPNLRILRVCCDLPFLGEFHVDRFPIASQLPASLRLFHVSDEGSSERHKILKWAAKSLPIQCSLLFE